MGKPLAGDVVVLPFLQTDLQPGKQSAIIYSAGRVSRAKLEEAKAKIRQLFA